MQTKTEIVQAARGLCPYTQQYTGYEPWIMGYVAAATNYEEQINRLRKLLKKAERKLKARM